ncbi:MAG: BamA/TamA family outer membrane protein, partial [Methylocella sp.]
GSLSLSGGYSTTEGFIAEVSVTETNFMGRGQYVRLAVSEGQFSRGVEFNFTEPYFLGDRVAAGFDIYAKKSDAFQFAFYDNFVTGATLRLGLPVTEEITFSPRYSISRTDISIPNNSARPFDDCPGTGFGNPIFGVTPGFGQSAPTFFFNCVTNGEASLALKEAQGPFVTSSFGYTLGYNALDNNKNPTGGLFAELRQDVAGAGGDERYVRTTADLRYYHDIYDQIVGLVHLQAGDLAAFGGSHLRIVDNFNLGPTLVRGFAPFGIGPRDVGTGDPQGNPLGGTKYFGASLEAQFPLYGVPRDLGLKGAIFADAGTLYGFSGRTNFSPNGACSGGPFVPPFTQSNCVTVGDGSPLIRTAAGGSIIWSSPLGPIRFDFAKVITKSQFDQTQFFRFTGGTTF